MAKRRGRKNVRRGQYRYTARRAQALKRAQAISARKRKGRITKGVIAASTLAGVGAAAVYGYKNRSNIGSDIRATKNRWRNAVQPGSKERVRLANALSGNLIKKPTKKTPATKGAKTFTRTQVAAVDPNVIDPHRNEAFAREGKNARIVDSLIEGSDRPYNIDKFLPKGVKGLVYGKRVSGNAASRAVAEHSRQKGKMGVGDVDASGILSDMVADGSVSRVVLGKENKRRKNAGKDPLPTPKSSRAGYGKKKAPKPTLQSKAFEQWIEDFD